MSTEQENKIIEQAQNILERRLAVEKPLKVHLEKLIHYSAYYQGVRKGLTAALSIIEHPPKGEERIYMEAEFRLYTSSLRNAQLWDDGMQIRYRNWEKDKKGKLTKCEAYFVEK
ncbi:MAG: hypothetical protein K6E67_10295 [Prevotella sp.]|nr:hypothetical protein [Prevotella sp.]